MMLCITKPSVLITFSLLLVVAITSADTDYGRASPHIVIQRGPFNISHDHSQGKRSAYAADLSPSSLKALYSMSQALDAGAGKTIAIIDAFEHSSAEADLTVFSNYYSLPLCTTDNGCFKRVNQNGGTTYTTATSASWAQETCLDLQWAHAIAPGANLLYVEANSDSLSDLMIAVAYASQNADYVSMSFGVTEAASHVQLDSYFASTTTSFFASAGDTGAQLNYPAASSQVIAVGGTTLYTSPSGAFAAEDGWSSSGGGCSLYFTATAAQQAYSASTCSTMRGIPDVSFNADPNSGVMTYVSEGCSSPPACWYTVGGTSLSSPIMAARSAVRASVVNSAYVYGDNIIFRDIIVGDNGHSCSAGYDLVTGLGSWIDDVGAAAAPTVMNPTPTSSEIPIDAATTNQGAIQLPTTTGHFAHLGFTGGFATSEASCNNISYFVILCFGAICLWLTVV